MIWQVLVQGVITKTLPITLYRFQTCRVLPMSQFNHRGLHSSQLKQLSCLIIKNLTDLQISADFPSLQAALINKKILVKVFNVELLWSHSIDPFFLTLSKESLISPMARKSSHLNAACGPLPCRAALGFSSLTLLSSGLQLSAAPSTVLITWGCLDCHTMFNGKLTYDEYCDTQHKRCYYSLSFCRTQILITVNCHLGNVEKIKTNSQHAYCAIVLVIYYNIKSCWNNKVTQYFDNK